MYIQFFCRLHTIFFSTIMNRKKRRRIPSNGWSIQQCFLDPANGSSFHRQVSCKVHIFTGTKLLQNVTNLTCLGSTHDARGLRRIRSLISSQISSLPFLRITFFTAQSQSHFLLQTTSPVHVLGFAEAPGVHLSPKPREKCRKMTMDDLETAHPNQAGKRWEIAFKNISIWRKKGNKSLRSKLEIKWREEENSSSWIGEEQTAVISWTKISIHVS